MEYTVDYFIKKFEAIPEELWTVTVLKNKKGQCCAFGHCGTIQQGDDYLHTEEAKALNILFRNNNRSVTGTNDLRTKFNPGSTPKERILNALRTFK